MDATYFRTLSARCRTAARHCFDFGAGMEFRKLADEFEQKADELERVNPPNRDHEAWHQ
jgi:hypothetical protein